ncbi:MAG TPA: c-type cytochrome [Bryobacteraceae bacterium]|nr:c-type cytochrome [Bryobacteraceae bacterium]
MLSWWTILILLQLPRWDLPATDHNPFTAPQDVEQGRKLFGGRCAGCHGPRGNGGKGADLSAAILPRASADPGLFRIVRYGIPDTEMPGSLMTDREIWQVAAFVRTLSQAQGPAATGDIAKGREVVSGKAGCLQCHALGPAGGRTGPSLSEVGLRRSPAYLKAKLLDPAGSLPEDFRLVSGRTRDGKQFNGVRLNEDTFSVQFLDSGGALRSLWKSDIQDYRAERRTLMPAYRDRLTGEQIDDAVAYLSSLRGTRSEP